MAKRKKKTKPKVRLTWKIHPATRVEKDNRNYSRRKSKAALRKLDPELGL